MTRSTGLLVVMMLALAPSTARAQDRAMRVLVVRTGQEPACLDPAALASAITRHSAFPSQVVLEEPSHVEGVVEVRVAREATRIAVQVKGSGHDLEQTIESAPCETMADVLAAFVASVLAPAPDVPVPTPSTAPGSIPSAEPMAEEAHARVERGVLLADALADYTPGLVTANRAGFLIVAGLTVTYAALALGTTDEDLGTGHVLLAGGALVAVAGGVTAAAEWGGEDAEIIGSVGLSIGLGMALSAGAFLDEEIDSSSLVVQRDTFHEADLVLGATVALTGVWQSLDRARLRPTSIRELAEIRTRIATPRQRATLTRADLASYERALRASKLPKWRYTIPMIAGTAVSFLLAGAETNTAEEERGQRAGVILGALAVLYVTTALIPDSATRYDRRLRGAGLDLTVAPLPAGAALSLGGRF